MASKHKRGKKWFIAYTVKNEATGEFDTPWVGFDNEDAADAFKEQIEAELKAAKDEHSADAAVRNATRTVEQLIWRYVRLVGKRKWGVRNYPNEVARIENYIIPHIGQWRVWDCTVLAMDDYFDKLSKMDAVHQRGKKVKKVSPKVCHEVHKFLKALFNKAMEWKMIGENPCKKTNDTMPVYKQKKIKQWTRNQFIQAAQLAETDEDIVLCCSMYLAVSTTLREGEICGLEWDRVWCSDEDIASGNSRVYVDRELARVDKETLIELDNKDVLKVFPNILGNAKSSLVLKTPKTESSIRTVWIAPTAARMLQKLKAWQEQRQALLDYREYNLVMTPGDGRPFEGSKLNNRMKALINRHGLDEVTFHSLRHTSTSYKLRISNGDIKSVQGDTGHATAQMVTDTYADIIDEDRKYNAQHFEEHFFQDDRPTEMTQQTEAAQKRSMELTPAELLNFMALVQQNPDAIRQVMTVAGATA